MGTLLSKRIFCVSGLQAAIKIATVDSFLREEVRSGLNKRLSYEEIEPGVTKPPLL